ncbi:MAG: hypothetical protein AAF570_04350, partial [Bacteroidota bacterium]
MRQLTFSTFVCTLLCMGFAYGQNPMSYNNVHQRTHVADFDFEETEREVLQEKVATFFAPEPIALNFSVLVRPDGSVKYVRAPHVEPEQRDFRLGGADALYKYVFNQ